MHHSQQVGYGYLPPTCHTPHARPRARARALLSALPSWPATQCWPATECWPATQCHPSSGWVARPATCGLDCRSVAANAAHSAGCNAFDSLRAGLVLGCCYMATSTIAQLLPQLLQPPKIRTGRAGGSQPPASRKGALLGCALPLMPTSCLWAAVLMSAAAVQLLGAAELLQRAIQTLLTLYMYAPPEPATGGPVAMTWMSMLAAAFLANSRMHVPNAITLCVLQMRRRRSPLAA